MGPDAKLFIRLEEHPDGRQWRLADVSVSGQHRAEWDAVAGRRAITQVLSSEIEAFAAEVPGFEVPEQLPLTLNGAGDFVEGGPHGDNGLSGKKLVADFYGPRVPIGGGALSGKDFCKPDRAGPLIARELAIAAVQRLGCRECTVTLAIRPGDREFQIVRAEAENGRLLDINKLRDGIDLRLICRESAFAGDDLVSLARWGYLASLPDRLHETTATKPASAIRRDDLYPTAAGADGFEYRLGFFSDWTIDRRLDGGWERVGQFDQKALQAWVADFKTRDGRNPFRTLKVSRSANPRSFNRSTWPKLHLLGTIEDDHDYDSMVDSGTRTYHIELWARLADRTLHLTTKLWYLMGITRIDDGGDDVSVSGGWDGDVDDPELEEWLDENGFGEFLGDIQALRKHLPVEIDEADGDDVRES